MSAISLDIPTLIFFVLPGAIILLLRSRFGEGREVAWTSILVLSAIYHIISEGVFATGEFGVHRFVFDNAERGFANFVFRTLGIPFIIGLGWGLWSSYSDRRDRGFFVRLKEAAGIQKYTPIHTAWHQIFSREFAAKVRVTLEDGNYIEGWYTGSAAVSKSESHDVYICRDFEQESMIGWWIPRSRIQSIEIEEIPECLIRKAEKKAKLRNSMGKK